MAVRKLKNGRWQADVVVGRKWDGTRDRRTATFPTQARARKAETAMLMEKERMRGRVSGRMTFGEFVEEVYWPQKVGLRANTRAGYERDLRLRLLPAFRDADLSAINKLSIQRMLAACPTRKTATNARETLSSVLSVAVEMGMLQVNPAGFRYQYPNGRVREDRAGDWLPRFDEHRRLLDHLREHHGGEPVERMVVLGLCEGMRKGEVLGLDWEQVDLGARELCVTQTYTIGRGGAHLTPPKTDRAERVIPIWAYAAERMEAWGPGRGPVVVGPRGGRMHPETAQQHLRRLHERECYDGGEPIPEITMQSLRHSFATACVNAGVDPTKLRDVMGHTDISTTMRYYVKQKLSTVREGMEDVIDAELGAASGGANAKKCE